MLDSTARAERIDLTTSEAACYTWEGPQKSLAVRLPLPLIDRLESEAVETFRSLTSRGSEIGGLLLGYSAPGAPAIVTVSDFELISCDYTRGPLYRLSGGDTTRFEQAVQKHGGNASTHVIGYFRSHTRKGLSLDPEDLAFLEPRFADPHHIVLLIRPFATKVSSAGIFIRENGKFSGENSHREFPFRSSELALLRSDKPETSLFSGSPVAPTAAQPAMPPKPQSRAQIVPIASRREIAPEPVVAPPTLPPIVVERVEAPAPPAAPKSQAPDRIEARIEAPVPVAPKPQAAAPAVEKGDKEKEKAAPLAKAVEAPAKAFETPAETPAIEAPAFGISLPVPEKKNKKLRLLVAAAVAMLVLGGGGLIVYPTLMRRANRPVPVQQDSSPLALRVERTPGGMLLTWNRDLPVIQSASKVVLSISDGDRRENIQLDPNQVRTGSILYPPITGDVSFQMEVTDPRQSKTTSESLRVLDPRPSPLDQPSAATPAAASKDNSAVKPAATADATPASAAAVDTKAPEDTPAPHPAANLKPFNTASLAQRLRPVTQADLPDDAPAIARATAPTGSASLPGMETAQQLPPPPKSAVPTPAPKVGGQLTSARVISKIDPEYPKLARQAGAGGVVELEATITTDGRVKNPRVIRGNSMLQRSAIDAVLQWRYQPAMLNGKPVDSPVEIKLNFVTQGH